MNQFVTFSSPIAIWHFRILAELVGSNSIPERIQPYKFCSKIHLIIQLPEDINCYASVGRCFVFKTRSAIDEAMATQLKNMSEQIEKTEAQKVVLEKKEKEIKDTVEELMKAAKK